MTACQNLPRQRKSYRWKHCGQALQYNGSVLKHLFGFTLVKYGKSSNGTLIETRPQPENENTLVQMVNLSYVDDVYAVKYAYDSAQCLGK